MGENGVCPRPARHGFEAAHPGRTTHLAAAKAADIVGTIHAVPLAAVAVAQSEKGTQPRRAAYFRAFFTTCLICCW